MKSKENYRNRGSVTLFQQAKTSPNGSYRSHVGFGSMALIPRIFSALHNHSFPGRLLANFSYSPLWFKLWRAANEYAAKHRIYKRPDKQKYTLSRHKADRTTWKICMTSTRHRKKQKQSSPFTDANKPRGIYWPPAQWGSGRVIFLSRAPRSLRSRARRCFVKERKEK